VNLNFAFTPGLMNQDAAAYYLNISTRSLNELQAQGLLIPKKLGRQRGFRRVDLDAFIESLPDWGDDKNSAA
jgi:hypothetical protein